MKLCLTIKETLEFIKATFPSTFIPTNYIVSNVESAGYPVLEIIITMIPELKEEKEEK